MGPSSHTLEVTPSSKYKNPCSTPAILSAPLTSYP